MRGFRRRSSPLANWDPQHPDLWPNRSESLLLRALLGDGAPAEDAWREWLAGCDPRRLGSSERALLPLLFLRAGRLGVSAELRSRLREAYLRTWAHNCAALRWLAGVVRRLEAAGVPSVVLKGGALLPFYYGDIGARKMADVDLLIREADLERTGRILAADGWEGPAAGLPPADVVPHMHAIAWTRPPGASLDLHWRPFTICCADSAEDRFWRHTQVRESSFGRMRVPGAGDLLILMCLHGRKQERHARARWVVDAMSVIARAEPSIDWDEVLEQCVASDVLLPVADALSYLAREHGAGIPAGFFAAARNIPTSDAARVYYALVSRNHRSQRGLLEIVQGRWIQYVANGRARGRIPSLRGFVRYYLASKRWEWNMPSNRAILHRVAHDSLRRLRSFGA